MNTKFSAHQIRNYCLILLCIFPGIAWAHSGGDASGFIAGALHPVMGLDHLLAMLSVGIVSAQFGGRWIWIVPALFVCMMIVGGVLGFRGVEFPMVEVGIASSVIVLGLGISVAHKQKAFRWSIPLTMIFVAIFGSLHGHAHGAEMPNSASPVYYCFGFIVTTCIIHLIGVLIGYVFQNYHRLQKSTVFLGLAIAGTGVKILLIR
jgi:urease accessory protein